ncbi:MAG: hypothetical protein AB2L22_16555 [Syntrophales bacterium]
MRKSLHIAILVGIMIFLTASFGFAEYAAAGKDNFPYFQFGCLVLGGMFIVSLKQRFPRIYMTEAVGSFALYTALVALFTNPVVDAIRLMVQ